MIAVDAEKCVRCGACVRDCIVEVLKPGADGVPCVASGEERFCLNCQHCLAVCPQGAVVCNGVTPEECAGIGPLPGAAELFNLLRQRRSIRQYRPENLEPEIIDRLVESLAWIPTGCNDHRLFFTVIREQREMAFFRAE